MAADRIYLMPVITDSTGKPGVRVPKYYDDIRSLGLSWSMVDYGAEPVALVGISQIPDAAHAQLVADPDVTAVPQNLDGTVGASLAAVQTALANQNIPENWVLASMTWRVVLKTVIVLFQFQQRLNGILPNVRLFDPNDNVTLNTTVGSLPANVRQALAQTAQSFGFSTAGLGGSTTLRQALQSMRQQFPNVAVQAFGQVF